jgi:hypothetical protein
MKLALSIAGLALLAGCTSIPVGGVAVCFLAKCEFKIKTQPPQSTAEKLGALAGTALGEFLSNRGR